MATHWRKQLIGTLLRSFVRLRTLHSARRFLLLFGVLLIGSGLVFLCRPVAMAGVFGLATLLPTGITDVRAFYGTMTLALGVLLIREAFVASGVANGMYIIMAFSGGSAIGRSIGMILDGSAGALHLSMLVGEIAATVWAWRAIQSEQRWLKRQQPIANPRRVEDFRPLSHECLENPYPFYKALRTQQPVYRAPGNEFWYVSRYADVEAVAMNTQDYSSNLVAIILGDIHGNTTMIEQAKNASGTSEQLPVDVLAIQDPPRHTVQRRLGLRNLSMRYVDSLAPHVRELSNAIMDRFIARGVVDWAQEFAKEIPMAVSLELVGFPTDNWRNVKHWCDDGIALLSGVNTPEQFAEHSMSSLRLIQFVKHEYANIKANPVGDNFTTALLAAVADPEVELTEAEAISIVFQVIIAGSDSSANTIANSVKMLAENPAMQIELRRDPSRIPNFIEEVLRLESPFQGHFRQTTRECEVAGVTLPKDARVMLLWASANRDETVFPDPDNINLDRPNLKAHLAFGRGIHQCLGALLARLEVRIALEELIKRTELIVLDHSKPSEHIRSVFVRELHHLPIRFVAKG